MSLDLNVSRNKPLQTTHTSATATETKTTGPGKDNHVQMKKGAQPKQRPTNEKREAALKKEKQRTERTGKIATAYSEATGQLTKTGKATKASAKALNAMVGKWNKNQKVDLKALNNMSAKTLQNMKDTRDAMMKLGGSLGMSKSEVSAFIAGQDDGKLSKLSADSTTRMMMTNLRDEYGVMQNHQESMQSLVDAARERDIHILDTTLPKNTSEFSKNALQMLSIEKNLVDPNMIGGDHISVTNEELNSLEKPGDKPLEKAETPKTAKTPQKETIEAFYDDAEAPVDTIIKKETSPKIKDSGGKPDKILESPVESPKKESVGETPDHTEAPITQKTPQKESIEAFYDDAEAPVDTIIKKETSPKIKDSGGKPDKILESPVESSKPKTEAPLTNEKVRIGDDDQQRLMDEMKNSDLVAKGFRQESPKTEAPLTNEKVRIGDDDQQRLMDEMKNSDSVAKGFRQESPKTEAPRSNEKVRIGDDDQQRLMDEMKNSDSVARGFRQESPKTEAPRSNEKVRIGDDDYQRQVDERKRGADFAPRLPLADRQARLNEMEKQLLPLLTEYFKLMAGGADAPKGPGVQRPPMQERKSIVKNSVGDVNASLRNPAVSDKVKENAPAVPKAINTMVGGMNMPNPMQAMMTMFLVSLLAKMLGMDMPAFAQLGKMFAGNQGGGRN